MFPFLGHPGSALEFFEQVRKMYQQITFPVDLYPNKFVHRFSVATYSPECVRTHSPYVVVVEEHALRVRGDIPGNPRQSLVAVVRLTLGTQLHCKAQRYSTRQKFY